MPSRRWKTDVHPNLRRELARLKTVLNNRKQSLIWPFEKVGATIKKGYG
jgi:hypothetical protein